MLLWSPLPDVSEIPVIGDIFGVVYDGFGEIIELINTFINFFDMIISFSGTIITEYINPFNEFYVDAISLIPAPLNIYPPICIAYALYRFIAKFGLG